MFRLIMASHCRSFTCVELSVKRVRQMNEGNAVYPVVPPSIHPSIHRPTCIMPTQITTDTDAKRCSEKYPNFECVESLFFNTWEQQWNILWMWNPAPDYKQQSGCNFHIWIYLKIEGKCHSGSWNIFACVNSGSVWVLSFPFQNSRIAGWIKSNQPSPIQGVQTWHFVCPHEL